MEKDVEKRSVEIINGVKATIYNAYKYLVFKSNKKTIHMRLLLINVVLDLNDEA